MLYKYIFYKAYYIAIRVFKETEFPWAFASIVLTLCLVTTPVVILKIIKYILLPRVINIYDHSHGYFALLICAIIMIYVTREKKYLTILKECAHLPIKTRIILSYISIFYILITFIAYFILGDLIVEYSQ